MPNQNILLSSAEGIDSELYDQYKLCYKKMLLGDPNYFVADISCEFSLHPFLNGVPIKPQLQQAVIDNAFATNPYKAQREYYNLFDLDGGEDVLVKRSTITKYSESYYPVFQNEDGTKKYIIAYDPATKLDNSVIAVAELLRDPERGLMAKFVNCVSLLEVLKNGEKMVMQKPEQVERLKDIIIDYNRGALDFENIDQILLDAGAGGGGTDIAQYLLNEWKGKDGKLHRGFIDKEDPYMNLRQDDYPGNAENIKLFNFKKDKTIAYERAQSAINQGLVLFPNDLNIRNEMEILETLPDGQVVTKYEKVTLDEMNALTQLSLMKEELCSMQKVKKPSGIVAFDLSAQAKQRNMHDDHADVAAMILYRLMELRAEEALTLEEQPHTEFKDMLAKASSRTNGNNANPFANMGNNPFAKYKGGKFR